MREPMRHAGKLLRATLIGALIVLALPWVSLAAEVGESVVAAEAAEESSSEVQAPTTLQGLPSATLDKLPLLVIEKDVTEVGRQMFYLEDPTGELGVEDVLLRLNELSELPGTGANFGFNHSAIWFGFRIAIERDDPTMVLDISYPHLDYVDVYHVGPIGPSDEKTVRVISYQPLGDRLNFSSRYRGHRTLNARLDGADSESLVLIRVRTQGSLALPIKVFSEPAFGEFAASENAGLFFYYGVLLVMVLFNAFLWLQTGDKVYRSYVGYLTTLLLATTLINGTLFQWVLPTMPSAINDAFLGLVMGTFTAALSFTLSFNGAALEGTKLLKASKALIFLQLVLIISTLFFSYAQTVRFIAFFSMSTPFLILTIGIYALGKGYRPARYFISAWLVFLSGAVIYGLKSFGLLPTFWMTEFGVQIGSAVEVTLLSLALGDKLKQFAAERDALNTRMLEQTARLVSESQKRTEAEHSRVIAERKGRTDAENRVRVFANVIHHLNNPLSHLQGTQREGKVAFQSLIQTIFSLLPDDSEDQDVKEVRRELMRDAERVRVEYRSASEALVRASTAVEVLRALSGIDGVSFARHPLSRIRRSLLDRLNPEYHDFIDALSAYEATEVVGNPELYAQAIVLILESLRREGITKFTVEVRPAAAKGGFHHLVFLVGEIPASERSIASTGDLCEELLATYRCRYRLEGEALTLELRATEEVLEDEL